MATLAQNLRRLMAEHLVSFKMLKASCDISFQTITDIRNGHVPQLPILRAIASAFKITLDELCGDTPQPIDLPKLVERVEVGRSTQSVLIERMISEGLNHSQVARILGLSRQFIQQQAKQFNFEPKVRMERKSRVPRHHQVAVARAALICGIERYRVKDAFNGADWVDTVELKTAPDGITVSDRQLMIAFYIGKGHHLRKAMQLAGMENPNAPAAFDIRKRLRDNGVAIDRTDGRRKCVSNV